jgi:coproporphyrinogen III oxidase
MVTKEFISDWLKQLQNKICNSLEMADGTGTFKEDTWTRNEGGGGITRIIENGNIIEKGGVLFSAVHGKTPEFIKKENGSTDTTFYATGVSIVIHPQSPMVPIIHMNVRYFEMSDGTFWFGGGIDLTPHYVDKDDAIFFHSYLKKVCDQNDSSYYTKFKKWADDYFYISHRNETRGIGGIFFDHLTSDANKTKEQLFEFLKDVGNSFAPIYIHFMNKNKNIPFGENEKKWQLLRRGRYVEFNLVYDKGTKFGLETNGRTESILMSLPQHASWQYNFQAIPYSKEQATLDLLKKNIEWIKD